MNNYLQKIVSRAAVNLPASQDNGGQMILPTHSPVFYNPQNDLVEDDSQQPEEQLLPPDNAGANLQNNENSKHQNIILPAPVNELAYKRNNEDRNQEDSIHIPDNNRYNRSTIEKITDRNVRNIEVSNSITELRTIKDGKGFEPSQKISPASVIPPQPAITKKIDFGKESHSYSINSINANQTLEKVRQILNPAKTDPSSLNIPKKNTVNNKLVIGRITVEVINPDQPPVKPRELTARHSTQPAVSTKEFTGINKRSFGLGQL